MVSVVGQGAFEFSVVSQLDSSAVEVMILKVEPGATWIFSASSRYWLVVLFAIARMLPVDGWMITIELFGREVTAVSAADCTFMSSVVFTVPLLIGLVSVATVASCLSFLSTMMITCPGVPPDTFAVWVSVVTRPARAGCAEGWMTVPLRSTTPVIEGAVLVILSW